MSYHAQILIKSKGRIVHQESSTFGRLTNAKAWLKRRENELILWPLRSGLSTHVCGPSLESQGAFAAKR